MLIFFVKMFSSAVMMFPGVATHVLGYHEHILLYGKLVVPIV